MFAEAQTWRGAAANTREEGGHHCFWLWVLGLTGGQGEGWSQGCSLPVQGRVGSSLEAPTWRSEARPEATPMLLKDTEQQGGSVGAAHCPFPVNKVLKCQYPSAVMLLILIHRYPTSHQHHIASYNR